jgi:hypothetical protein
MAFLLDGETTAYSLTKPNTTPHPASEQFVEALTEASQTAIKAFQSSSTLPTATTPILVLLDLHHVFPEEPRFEQALEAALKRASDVDKLATFKQCLWWKEQLVFNDIYSKTLHDLSVVTLEKYGIIECSAFFESMVTHNPRLALVVFGEMCQSKGERRQQKHPMQRLRVE